MKNYRMILPRSADRQTASVPTHEHHVGFHKNYAPRPLSKLRLYPSKPTKFIIAAAFSTFALISSAAASSISVDFHGNVQTNTLSTTDIAGVVPTNTWTPALGLFNGGMPAPATVGPSAVVAWNAPIDGLISPSALSNPDENMMEGYIAGSFTAVGATPAQVRFSSISLVGLGWSAYDVYVYADTGFNNNAFSIEHLGGSLYGHLEDPGGYGNIVTTYADSQVAGQGNYVKFSGLTANTFTLEALPFAGGSDISAINGVQIVGVPEPSTGLLTLLSTAALVLRRRRS
jgi:hypothetical protein